MVLGQHVVSPPPKREKLDGNLWFLLKISEPGSVLGIVTGYVLDGLGIESQLEAIFSTPVQTLTSSYCHGHERVELYLYSPYGRYVLYRASVPVQGCTF
jgi:membrane protein YqaA with SNARE-associated domain